MMKKNELIYGMPFGFAFLLLLLFINFCLNLSSDNQNPLLLWIFSSNLHFYFSMLVLFVVSFLTIYFIQNILLINKPNILFQSSFSLQTGKILSYLFLFVVALLFLHWFFVNQKAEFAYSYATMPAFLAKISDVLFVISLGTVLTIYAVVGKKDVSSYLVLFSYIICVIFTFFGLYIPNCLVSDFYHGQAIIESIYNVCDLIPFSQETTGIYGHYGLLFLPFLKILGSDLAFVAGGFALAGSIACIASLYVIHKLLPKNWIRIVTAFAILITDAVLRTTNHWQSQPLRIVFPCLFMAYAVYITVNDIDKNKRFIGAYILGLLAVLWNTEVGIFCLISYSAYEIALNWQINSFFSKQSILKYINSMIYIVSAVFVSVLIVNIYNYLCGGEAFFRLFFFPLLEENYMDGIHKYNMEFGNHAWVYVLFLFLFLLCYGIFHTKLFQNKDCSVSKISAVAVLIACLGLLNFSYYVNRAVYKNLMICYPMAVCANAFLIGRFWDSIMEHKQAYTINVILKRAISFICIAILLCCSMNALYAPVIFNQRQANSWYSLQNMRNEVMQIPDIIPEETYGIGEGISIIYHMLGWSNYGHFRDIPDLVVDNNYTLPFMVEETLKHDNFLVRTGWLEEEILKIASDYTLVATVNVQFLEYHYYVKQ